MSDSFASKNWEKLLLVAGCLLGVTGIGMGTGYFKQSGADAEITQLKQDLSVAVRREGVPVPPPALVGVDHFAAALAPTLPSQPRQWSFYDYKGYKRDIVPVPPDPDYCLPPMTLEAECDSYTGDILVSWKRAVAPNLEHPRPGLAGQPSQFDMVLYRYEVAAGPAGAVVVDRGPRYEGQHAESLGVEVQGGVAGPEPGKSYAFFLELKTRPDLKLKGGCEPTMRSETAAVTLPSRFSLKALRLASRGSRHEVDIGILGSGPLTGVRVPRSVLSAGLPVPLDEEQQAALGTPALPFRASPSSRPGPARPLTYHDLQRGFFDVLYPQRELYREGTSAAPESGGGASAMAADAEGVRDTVKGYWGAIIDGKPKDAVKLLDLKIYQAHMAETNPDIAGLSEAEMKDALREAVTGIDLGVTREQFAVAIDAVEPKINGDTAELQVPGVSAPILLRRDGKGWLITWIPTE